MSRVTTVVYRTISKPVKKTHGQFPGTEVDPFAGHVILTTNQETLEGLYTLTEVDFAAAGPVQLQPKYPPPAPATRVDTWDWKMLDKYTIPEYKEKFYRHGLEPPKGGRKADYKEFALRHRKELSQ